MKIAPDLLERIVDHARRDTSEECCGVVATRDGVAVEVYELENLAHDRRRFEVDGAVLAKLLFELEDRGEELGGIYHSHVMSAPEPSQTDLNFGRDWPGVEWIIVGLQQDEPEVRSWLIEDGDYREVELLTE
ncbi:Mov34/MPN/PAD-1 family protein [Paraconexibacter sp.]|uniref:Mov34/MPN/PAD-1 family protein n=1 Tax=Paraconexibacter sp. TaxID=2949640 RepID=UPI0035679B3F